MFMALESRKRFLVEFFNYFFCKHVWRTETAKIQNVEMSQISKYAFLSAPKIFFYVGIRYFIKCDIH